jgi:hypothetical protein
LLECKGHLGELPLDMRIIKIDLEVLEWKLLAQDEVPWLDIVYSVMDLRLNMEFHNQTRNCY